MVSGRARVMQQTDPRKVRPLYRSAPRWTQWASVWENNPRIARADERGDFQLLHARDPVTNMRPYHTAKTPDRWLYNLRFRPDVGELYFTDAEKAFGAKYTGRVIVEPHIKHGASPNKQWGWVRWNKLAWMMQESGLRVTQLGPVGTQLLDGAEHIITGSFRLACAVLANARGAILHEGGTHHAAAALGIPAVVIFGGYIPVELTGYPMHRNIGASLEDACGMRKSCSHCAKWMESIKPENVLDEVSALAIDRIAA